jgi:diguanylate cyclase (GGDEF)-like protein
MTADLEKRRVLIATEAAGSPLLPLFRDVRLAGWKADEAITLEQARYFLQHRPYDVLLLTAANSPWNDTEGLIWLTRQRDVPVLLLAQTDPGMMIHALENGANQWLPLGMVLDNPALLAAALSQVARLTELRRKGQRLGTALQEAQLQIDRLVGLLWRTIPGEARLGWFPQRSMMERLHEEVVRSERFGDPLTVVLGEVDAGAGADWNGLDAWVADSVVRAKRRCDLAGQYGPHGFVLLLIHTPEAGGVVCVHRMQKALGQPGAPAEGSPGSIRSYFGMAAYSSKLSNAKQLLGMAEHQLEAAKQAGESLVPAV